MDVAAVTAVQQSSGDLHRPFLVRRYPSRVLAVALGLGLCALSPHAQAADTVGSGTNADKSPTNEAGPSADQSSFPLLPGDWFREFQRERNELGKIGITFSLQEDTEVWAVPIGGGKQGLSYNGLTTGKLDMNLEALVGWKGAEFFAQGYYIHGHGPSRSLVGNMQLVSNLEAAPSVKLYDLWLDQKLLDGKLSVRFGQEGANDEFMDTAFAALYINSSFGFPGMPAAVLPSGGPNYPLATPFVRVQFNATDKLTMLGGVFNGDPAPPGTGDPQIRDRNGTAFRLDDHAFAIGEFQYQPDPEASPKLPTTYKFGAWYSSSNFADQRFDTAGGLLASPMSTGIAQRHSGDWALYGIIDQTIWQLPDTKDQGIGVFLQVMGGPSDRNISNFFAEGGINWVAPFTDRPKDILGFAVSYLGISPAARAFSRDLVSFGRGVASYASNETVLELTYQAPIADWLTLQPDLQYVINPNAGVPNTFSTHPLPNALVIGTRLTIKL